MNWMKAITRGLSVNAILLVGSIVSAQAADVQHVVSDKGIEAWLVEEHSLPMIVLKAGWKGGALRDPEGKEGLTMMMTGLLNEGAGEYDSQAFQEKLDDLAIQLNFDANQDDVDVALKTLTENRDEAVRLLKLALKRARFDPEAIERIRAQMKVNLQRNEQDPRKKAYETWYDAALPGHPYARPSGGTEESIESITREQLAAAQMHLLGRNNLNVSVVGDITADELKTLLDDIFSELPEVALLGEELDTDVKVGPQTLVSERDNPQSIVVFGGPGLLRDDPDFIPAFVMNYILAGGNFSSRLMIEVREKRGLAYSVGANFYPLDHVGLFLGQVATQNERVEESLDIIKSELALMAEKGVSEEELANAKTYLTGSYPLRFDSNEKIANQLHALQMGGLSIDYVVKRNGLINEVTQDDIARVARRLLHPNELIVSIVGKPVLTSNNSAPAETEN
ncbi:MAG: zinc protease [Parvibaculaceae bacterium]|jgi:zinc protease